MDQRPTATLGSVMGIVLVVALVLVLGVPAPALARQDQPKDAKPAGAKDSSAPSNPKDAGPAKKEAPAAKASPKAVKKVLPKDVVQASNDFQHAAPCRTCHGTGEVTVSKVVGKREIAPGVSMPVGKTEKEQCSNCKGERVATGDGVLRHGKRAAQTMAGVDTSHAEWAKQVPRITENLRKAARVSAAGWQARCASASESLVSQAVGVDEPVLVVASLKEDSGTGSTRRLTFALGTKELVLADPRVVLVTPRSEETTTRVLVGGVFVKAENGALVIRSGFAVDCE